MRHWILILGCWIGGCLFNQVNGQDYKWAAGIRICPNISPTLSSSVSGKFFIHENKAIEGLVSFGNRFGIGGLYEVQQLMGAIPHLYWYYGGGAFVGFQFGNVYTGPTGIVGIDYTFTGAPINLSLDWKPELDISPAINLVPDAFAVTVRFAVK